MAAPPASLKALTPYVKRAEELDKASDQRSKLVAYFCRTCGCLLLLLLLLLLLFLLLW